MLALTLNGKSQMYRRYTWASQHGGKVVSGLLIGLGVFLMILLEILPPKFSITIMAISFCIIALGIIRFFIEYLTRKRYRQ